MLKMSPQAAKQKEEASNKLNNINKKARCGTPERACKPKID